MDNPQKPMILRNMGVKLLVAVLCLLSFLAGFYAHQSRQMNHCKSLNQQFVVEQSVVICQASSIPQ